MQEKLTSWFLGLPAIVIILVLALVAVLWFGVKYLNKRESFWMKQCEAKDAVIKDVLDKVFGLYEEQLNKEAGVASELREMQAKIDAWFRK